MVHHSPLRVIQITFFDHKSTLCTSENEQIIVLHTRGLPSLKDAQKVIALPHSLVLCFVMFYAVGKRDYIQQLLHLKLLCIIKVLFSFKSHLYIVQ